MSQLLPPGMAKQFAERAKRGEADRVIGKSVYVFYQGTTEISLVSVDPPAGNLRKMNKREQDEAKAFMDAKNAPPKPSEKPVEEGLTSPE